jgi:hypothetical protein
LREDSAALWRSAPDSQRRGAFARGSRGALAGKNEPRGDIIRGIRELCEFFAAHCADRGTLDELAAAAFDRAQWISAQPSSVTFEAFEQGPTGPVALVASSSVTCQKLK